MKRFIYSIAFFFSLLYNLHAQWVQLPDYVNHEFIKISFPTESVGYAFTYWESSDIYIVSKTTDGGNSWNQTNFQISPNTDLQAIHFSDPDSGMIAYRRIGTEGMRVLRTFDGGSSWTDVSPDTSNVGTGVAVARMTSGKNMHFSTGSTYYRTTNGGVSWDSTSLTLYNNMMCMDFADENNGMAGFFDGTFNYSGGVYHTSNAGQLMAPTIFTNAYSEVDFISYPSTAKAYCLTDLYYPTQIHRSTDGGLTWDSVAVSNMNQFDFPKGFEFSANGKGYLLSGGGKILFSTDDGSTWSIDRAVDSTNLEVFDLVGNKAYAAGYDSNNNGILFVKDNAVSIKHAIKKQQVNIFPNPVSSGGIIHISGWERSTKSEWTITDSFGRFCGSWENVNENGELLLPQLSAGVYFLHSSEGLCGRIVVAD